MSASMDQLAVYLHLAQAARRQLRMPDRDRLLVLAACCAEENQMPVIASYCRHQVLQNNPGHMLRHWETVSMAMADDNFKQFLKQIKRRFALERAETMLSEYGIDRARERETYFNDEEYAASLLGVDLQWLQEHFG